MSGPVGPLYGALKLRPEGVRTLSGKEWGGRFVEEETGCAKF